MLAYLHGKIIKKTPKYFIVNVNDLGYKVMVIPAIIAAYSEGDSVDLYVHQYVREDELSLYGFTEFAQLEMFELLISISGIGPKLGFNIISTTTPAELRKAVASTNLAILSRIPGIGKKSASKIMLELSSKLEIEQDIDKILFSPDDELAVEALTNLGFKKNEAMKAIHEAGRAYDKLEGKIRAGLKYLNR